MQADQRLPLSIHRKRPGRSPDPRAHAIEAIDDQPATLPGDRAQPVGIASGARRVDANCGLHGAVRWRSHVSERDRAADTGCRRRIEPIAEHRRNYDEAKRRACDCGHTQLAGRSPRSAERASDERPDEAAGDGRDEHRNDRLADERAWPRNRHPGV